MKRLSFRHKIIIINCVAFTLVVVTGIFAYQRFTVIISQISDKSRINNRMLQVKSILNDMSEAENHVKSFSITKDTMYLRKYYTKVLNCQHKWDSYSKLEARNNVEKGLTDSLSVLITSKFDVLNELLILQDNFRVREALDKVVDDIETSVQTMPEEAEGLKTTEKKKGFLAKLFRRKKNKEENVANLDSTVSKQKITLLKVSRHVEKVKQEEEAIADSLRNKEFALILADKSVTDQIRSVVSQLESVEALILHEQTLKAKKSLEKTNFQIALFCIAVGLLLLIVTHTIFRYINYNNRFKKALRKAKAAAEDLALTKDKFFTNISHEIRTPMNAIAGFSNLIGEGPLTDSQREQLGMLQKSTDHLLYLINDVLDLAKLDAGKLRLEAVGFHSRQLLTEIRNLMQPIATENETELMLNIESIPEDDDVLIGDPYRLKQILLNIIGNAIKFTKKGIVTISSITEDLPDKVKLNIEVTDTGIGMSKKQLDKVFMEFEQADISISRTYGGSGLGLSIVYKLIKLHGGEIEIQSKQGVGTSVYITLYYKKGTVDNVQKSNEDSNMTLGLPQQLRVLIADDEEYNRKLLIAILKKYNAVCVEAENGIEAVKEVKKNHFDVILMDSRMPRMTGVEAVAKIRKLESYKKEIPIIALTAAISENDQKMYREAGMQGFVAKPFKERELIQIINNVMNNDRHSNFKIISNPLPEEKAGQHLDLTELKNLSGSSTKFYTEMLEMFLETTNEGMKNIQKNLSDNNWPKVADHAHKISAPCRHVGANELYNLIKKIETCSRSQQETETVPEMYEMACKEFEWVEKEIKKELLN